MTLTVSTAWHTSPDVSGLSVNVSSFSAPPEISQFPPKRSNQFDVVSKVSDYAHGTAKTFSFTVLFLQGRLSFKSDFFAAVAVVVCCYLKILPKILTWC